MAEIKCDLCPNPSVIFQRYSGKHLCSQHFIRDLELRVSRKIKQESLISPGERIAVGLSGGKDSVVLTYLLHKLAQRYQLQLIAITVDEGIQGYRSQTIRAAALLCSKLGIQHRIVSFKSEFGQELDEMISKLKLNPCTPCGVFRKYLLNREARKLGAAKLAMGHNLDDESQTILLNYLRGDIFRLARIAARSDKLGMVPRIKPLNQIPEKETMLYALLNQLDFSDLECPYSISRPVFRAQLRDLLNRLEDSHPGIKYGLLRGFQKLSPMLLQLESKQYFSCSRCGEPSSAQICSACLLLEKLAGAL